MEVELSNVELSTPPATTGGSASPPSPQKDRIAWPTKGADGAIALAFGVLLSLGTALCGWALFSSPPPPPELPPPPWVPAGFASERSKASVGNYLQAKYGCRSAPVCDPALCCGAGNLPTTANALLSRPSLPSKIKPGCAPYYVCTAACCTPGQTALSATSNLTHVNCGAGQYPKVGGESNKAGLTRCYGCAPGRYGPGGHACFACPKGKNSKVGSKECT